MSQTRSVVHDTFVVERKLTATPTRAFDAFADLDKKRRWFGPQDDSSKIHELDFRVGGREHAEGTIGQDTQFSYDVVYQDIVTNERIVYSYEMQINGQRISVSVATVEFRPTDAGTDLVVTEQGAYLDGLDNPLQRRDGTEQLMDAFRDYVESDAP